MRLRLPDFGWTLYEYVPHVNTSRFVILYDFERHTHSAHIQRLFIVFTGPTLLCTHIYLISHRYMTCDNNTKTNKQPKYRFRVWKVVPLLDKFHFGKNVLARSVIGEWDPFRTWAQNKIKIKIFFFVFRIITRNHSNCAAEWSLH